MNGVQITIRDAVPEDAGRLLEIYRHYVENTAVSFEYVSPSPAEFRARMVSTQRRYPYLVLLRDGCIEGYAYAGPFKARAAYDRSVETTIYLAPDAQKQGLGRMLCEALEEALRKMGVLNLYACVAFPEREDEYLTTNSADFHAHLGYTVAGHYHKCGWKFGRWYDMIWMEKMLGEHGENPAPVVDYPSAKRR